MTMNEIKPFNGYKPVQEQLREQLPVGGYVCQIINAQAETRQDGSQQLAVMVEIAEGPYINFFHRDYQAQQNRMYSPKYRGVCRILCPGSQLRPEDSWIVDRFNLSIGAIMSSNPGYAWNWDAASLKGLTVGISVRENEYRGNVYTEIGKLIPIAMIRDGSFRPMRRRVSQESGIVQGYPTPAYPAHSAAEAPMQAPMTPRAGGYSLPQGQGVQAVQNNVVPGVDPMSPAAELPAALPANYTDDTDIPF